METSRKEKLSLAQEAHSKLKARRLFLAFILLSAFSFQVSVFSSGCSHLKERSRNKNRLSTISTGDLKGMNKVDVIKDFGQPVATSKSEVSECWYYVKPKATWIWFKENKVDHWQVQED